MRFLRSYKSEQAEQIAKLFKTQYNGNYPYQEVNNKDYWLSLNKDLASKNRLGSLVITQGSNIVAHFYCRWNQYFSCIEVLLHTFSKEHLNHLSEMKDMLWNSLSKWAKQNKIQTIIEYVLCSEPILLLNHYNKRQFQEIAILPLKSNHQYLLRITNLNEENKTQKQVFVPINDAFIVQNLYKSAGLKREIKKNYFDGYSEKNGNGSKKTDEFGFSLDKINELGILRMQVFPSKATSTKSLINRILNITDTIEENSIFQVCVDSSDPKTIEFVELLESIDFKLNGIIPTAEKEDFLIYSKSDYKALTQAAFATQQARELRKLFLIKNNSDVRNN